MKPSSFYARIRDTQDGCREWTGAKHSTGYGAVWNPGKKLIKSHRFAWALENGPIPDGMQVLHRCDNRLCVNVDHLFLGSNTDNYKDKISKGRDRKACGAKNHASKYAAEDIRRMREAHLFGASQTDLAKVYGSTQGHIGKIVRRELWQRAY
jgi:hypothetical protein